MTMMLWLLCQNKHCENQSREYQSSRPYFPYCIFHMWWIDCFQLNIVIHNLFSNFIQPIKANTKESWLFAPKIRIQVNLYFRKKAYFSPSSRCLKFREKSHSTLQGKQRYQKGQFWIDKNCKKCQNWNSHMRHFG